MEIALLPGEDRWEKLPEKNGQQRICYTYRTERGSFFSCICRTLEEAHERCEDWMLRQERY